MALTPKQLIDELAKTGRHVSKRLLTDWRQRRLLPELTHKGRGPGKGASYFWEQANILDQAAFIADLPSWDTPQIILALWCCGFKVPRESLREAWLDAVARLARSWAKQDMEEVPSSAGDWYFDELGDNLHRVATLAQKESTAQGHALAEHAYELAQLALTITFASDIPEEIDYEIQYVNGLIGEYYAALGRTDALNIEFIDFSFVEKFRTYVNLFEIQKAVREASPTQFDAVQSTWTTVCRIFEIFFADNSDRKLGLTNARRMQGTFGPVFVSCLIVALRTRDARLLVRLSQHFATNLDNFESERRDGHWQGADGLLRYLKETGWYADQAETALWNEFWG